MFRTFFTNLRIHRSGNSTSQEDKPLKPTYKDVKPRVDTRWRKFEMPSDKATKALAASLAAAQTLKAAVPLPVAPPKPILRRFFLNLKNNF